MTAPSSRIVSMMSPNYNTDPVIDGALSLVGVHALYVVLKVMKFPATILGLIACVLASSCSTTTRHVSLGELEARLQADTKKQQEAGGRPWYQWSYIGSAGDRHYFRRRVGRMFYSEPQDGFYGLPKETIPLAEVEYARPERDDSTRWKDAFTKRDSYGMPVAYSTRFGVDGAPDSKKEAQQAAP